MKQLKKYMKTSLLLSIMSICFFCSYKSKSSDVLPSSVQEESIDLVYFPTDIFTKPTYQIRMDSLVKKLFKEKDLHLVESELKRINQIHTRFYAMYWKAYLLYYTAVFYQNLRSEDDLAAKTIAQSLQTLQEREYENSEYYALLAQVTSFSIQFATITQLARVSTAVETAANHALELNKNNLRAYLVLASHNFHTPKMFGGMKKVETYALKGLACPDVIENTEYSPTWGRNQLYHLLEQYYEQEGKTKALEELHEKYNARQSTP